MSKPKRKAFMSKRGKLLSTSACCATIVLGLTALPNVASAQTFDIQSASANTSHRNFPASNAIDGNLASSSRWAGRGNPEELILDLGSTERVDDIQIAWTGTIRYSFRIEGRSGTSGSWTEIFEGQSSGNGDNFENFNVSDIDARQVRITGLDSNWSNINEVRVIGTAGPNGSPSPLSLIHI